MTNHNTEAYTHILDKIAEQRCVILDGGVSTEIERSDKIDWRISDQGQWGTWSLNHAPQITLDVHRQFVEVGCDLVTTNTWAVLSPPDPDPRSPFSNVNQNHWMDSARLGIQLAQQAIQESGREGQCAVAFSINGSDPNAHQPDTLQLLSRIFKENPPDLILFETLSLIRENDTFPAIELMLSSSIPVWISFRRCRHGVCGVFGQHWGGPEGDLFGRAAQRFETMGVGALLINCLPIDHVSGMIPWLRDFTDMPLGVYPNLGHYLDPGWKFDDRVGPDEYAELALKWREEGAQIIGGCCGVTSEQIKAIAEKLDGTKPGQINKHKEKLKDHLDATVETRQHIQMPKPWVDDQNRKIYPIPFPEIVCDPGVFLPTQGSFLLWKYLFNSEVGNKKKCLDVGCGTGVLSVQLALNKAELVTAIDVQKSAIANTMTNAFRNGVADRVTGKVVDLYTYIPEEKYDIVVASLYQMPVNPTTENLGHRPADYWGRNQLDHMITLLPDLLTEDGKAYVMQISILSQLETAKRFNELGMDIKVIDFNFFQFNESFLENLDQIERVEQISDAYHLNFSDVNVMVMYLLEVSAQSNEV